LSGGARAGTRPYSSPRRQEQAEATQGRILEAFARQLGRPGAGDINVTEAAREAGVAVRTVYHYFPDRRARVEALAAWTQAQFGPVEHPLQTVDDLPGYARAAYARAERHEALTRAGLAAGLSTDVRVARHQRVRARIRELLATIGAPEPETQRAAALVAVLESSEAGFPLVDLHGLSFGQAGQAAAEGIEAVIARLRSQAAPG
jgi:AcrR family transcriptional regulator